MPMVGGIGAAQEPTEEVIGICDKIKGDLEAAMNRTFAEFTPKQYKSQVVAGLNFFIKIHVGDGDHVHVRVFRGLDGSVTLHSQQTGKKESDEITYF